MNDYTANFKLRKLQLCELEILDEFVRICEKYKLQYFLAGGTLLGAKRYGGFIPWDDDIDIEMPRIDYELFAELCKVELNNSFFYQSHKTDSNYFLTYAKLRKNGTYFYEERFKHSRFHKGIFIDIFPIDPAPKPSLIGKFFFNLMAVGNRCGQVDSGEKYIPYKKISGKICYALLKVFTPNFRTALRKFLIFLSKLIGKKGYFASYSGAYGYLKEVFQEKWYFPSARIKFEGKDYNSPANTDMILETLFGVNYMIEPPKDEQHIHCDLNKVIL